MSDGSYDGMAADIHAAFVKHGGPVATLSNDRFSTYYQSETGTGKYPRTEARDKIAEAVKRNYNLKMMFMDTVVLIAADWNFSPLTL